MVAVWSMPRDDGVERPCCAVVARACRCALFACPKDDSSGRRSMLGVVSEVIVTAVAVAGALAGAATTRRVADGKDGRDLADRRQGRVQKAAAAAAATSSRRQKRRGAAAARQARLALGAKSIQIHTAHFSQGGLAGRMSEPQLGSADSVGGKNHGRVGKEKMKSQLVSQAVLTGRAIDLDPNERCVTTKHPSSASAGSILMPSPEVTSIGLFPTCVLYVETKDAETQLETRGCKLGCALRTGPASVATASLGCTEPDESGVRHMVSSLDSRNFRCASPLRAVSFSEVEPRSSRAAAPSARHSGSHCNHPTPRSNRSHRLIRATQLPRRRPRRLSRILTDLTPTSTHIADPITRSV
ncbi:hypothetical protein L1887_55832 [Cichorium endivia]|nr:hypothetical protein L1887_55832 [Cichorium endivia]